MLYIAFIPRIESLCAQIHNHRKRNLAIGFWLLNSHETRISMSHSIRDLSRPHFSLITHETQRCDRTTSARVWDRPTPELQGGLRCTAPVVDGMRVFPQAYLEVLEAVVAMLTVALAPGCTFMPVPLLDVLLNSPSLGQTDDNNKLSVGNISKQLSKGTGSTMKLFEVSAAARAHHRSSCAPCC